MIINDSRKVVVILVEWFLSGVPNKLRAVENKYYNGGMLQYVLSSCYARLCRIFISYISR